MNISQLIRTVLDRLRYGSRVDPARDWLVLVMIGAVLFVGILVWNVVAFEIVAGGGVIGTHTSSTPVFSRSSLDAIQKVFTDRAAEEAKYQDGTYRFADPSQ